MAVEQRSDAVPSPTEPPAAATGRSGVDEPAAGAGRNAPSGRPGVYESVVRPTLFRLDPERAHDATVRAAELAGRSAITRRAAHRLLGFSHEALRVDVAGLRFENPIGLAAGFDKNARAAPMLGAVGFGHVEIGSVSAYPSAGNPRPRLFRIPRDRGIVVAYGVPNEGAETVAGRLAAAPVRVPVGVNLVKTNDPARPAVEPDVYEDYATSFARLAPHAAYVALNMSCPNSAADKDFFDDTPRVHRLLERLAREHPRVPVFLKLKPTTDAGVLEEIVAIADGFPFVAGFAINLPSGKPPVLRLSTSAAELDRKPGAVGGPPVEAFVNEVLATLYAITAPRGRYAIMAAGGVTGAQAAYRKLTLGADLVQLYTGLIYQGPRVVKDILSGLVPLLERDGHATVADAVGSATRR
jgi:dihydroorotate dehydrogenase (fumarate)/dihydroorotate dehydrogenase